MYIQENPKVALKDINANTENYALHILRRGAPFSGVTPAERTAVTKELRTGNDCDILYDLQLYVLYCMYCMIACTLFIV